MTTSILDFLHFNNPTTGQVTALKGIQSFVELSFSDKFLILRGAAGTGKTSIVSALVGGIITFLLPSFEINFLLFVSKARTNIFQGILE